MKKHVNRKSILIVTIALVLVVLGVGILNQAGYVLDGPYLVKGGTLTIKNSLPGSEIFIDNDKRSALAQFEDTLFVKGIAPGTHTVIVSNDIAWPWIREFESESATNHTISPLQIEKSVTGSTITEDSPFYEQATRLLSEYREPTQSNPFKAVDSKLWIIGTSVRAQRGDQVFETLNSQYPIRSVAWYKDRNDVVLVAAQSGIFAIDLEEHEPRNFQPVYKGTEPTFVVNPLNTSEIYVADGDHILSIRVK